MSDQSDLPPHLVPKEFVRTGSQDYVSITSTQEMICDLTYNLLEEDMKKWKSAYSGWLFPQGNDL